MSESEAPSLWDELWDFSQLEESEFITADYLRKILERHGATPGNNTNVSDYQFFYEACCNDVVIDEAVIQLLIEYFPEAANFIADDGWTPFLAACYNDNVTVGIVQVLIDAAPDSVRRATNDGFTPLHMACLNRYVNFDIIQLLLDAAPDSVRSADDDGNMPLHVLCYAGMDDTSAIDDVLKLLLEKCPESIRHASNAGSLPMHYAAKKRSPEFCRELIEAYPGSERISNDDGMLPLHCACWTNNDLATVEYIYKLYPDAVNHRMDSFLDYYPIHVAIRNRTAVNIVQFLLDCDPNVKLQKFDGKALLQFACEMEYDYSNIDAALQVIKALYDAHPEAIEDTSGLSNILRFHQRVQTFINGELVHARQARDHRLITTPDDEGRLPLHTALQNNVRLGSIKLLVKGNPSAIRHPDNEDDIPLYLACHHHDSPKVIQYLLDLDSMSLLHEDHDNNTILHYACRRAKYDTIATLLEKYDSVSVSKRNAQKKLPIELLWESSEVGDRNSVKYLDSMFRLLKAYPETFKIGMQVRQPVSDAHFSPSMIGRKRKFEH